MATNPVQRIREREYSHAIDLHLPDFLRDIAKIEPNAENPYLSLYLDWTPNFEDPGRLPAEDLKRSQRRNVEAVATSKRPSRTWFEQQAKAALADLDPRSQRYTDLEADILQINAYLDIDLDPSARGVFIVSNVAAGVFEPIVLGVPVESSMEFGPLPSLSTLAHVSEDYATYGILVVNQKEAELSFVTQGTKDSSIYLESNLYPRHQRQGSISEVNYRERAGQRVLHFAKAIAEEVTVALRNVDVDALVLVGSEVFMTPLVNQFSEEAKALIVAQIPYDLSTNPNAQTLIELTAPYAAEAERAEEAKAVETLRNELGSGRGVAGTVDVLNALMAHQVHQLVINEDYHERGWGDLTMGVYGVGDVPAEHPTGGDVADLVEVDLVDAFVRLTLQSDGTVEFIHTSVAMTEEAADPGSRRGGELPRNEPAVSLDEVGGVGAILRFTS
ncbi:MAG: baeRF10 domain-containing protein [Thermomicrobiales bacterium]